MILVNNLAGGFYGFCDERGISPCPQDVEISESAKEIGFSKQLVVGILALEGRNVHEQDFADNKVGLGNYLIERAPVAGRIN